MSIIFHFFFSISLPLWMDSICTTKRQDVQNRRHCLLSKSMSGDFFVFGDCTSGCSPQQYSSQGHRDKGINPFTTVRYRFMWGHHSSRCLERMTFHKSKWAGKVSSLLPVYIFFFFISQLCDGKWEAKVCHVLQWYIVISNSQWRRLNYNICIYNFYFLELTQRKRLFIMTSLCKL